MENDRLQMKDKNPGNKKRIKKLIDLLKSLKGEKPDYENLDHSDYSQTEEEYQEEQKKWIETMKKKKDKSFSIHPIGFVKKMDEKTWIEIDSQYKDAMLGLEGFSNIHVFFWFHENDTQEGRSRMQVHPRGDPKIPLTGVFATHSPLRPNLVGMTLCKILSIQGTVIEIESIDARDNSPVIDIKCYIPYEKNINEVTVPGWV